MTEKQDRLRAAIEADHARQAEARRQAEEEARSQREAAMAQKQREGYWGVTASAMILNGVVAASNAAARDNSRLLFRPMPPTRRYSAHFELHPSGSLDVVAWLDFALNDAGQVTARTSVQGVRLPDPIPLDAITQRWAEEIATDVLVGALQRR